MADISITHTVIYCLDLDRALEFYTKGLGFEVRVDAPATPTMRWLTVAAPGSEHEVLLSALDQGIAEPDREAMRQVVTKGNLAVFVQVSDVDAIFERLLSTGVEVMQEPIDQPYAVRDCAVRDPSGNQVRLSQPLAGQS